jgi:tRNA(Ile)-lysidine synthase
VSRNAPAADGAISAAEANWLFRTLDNFPVLMLAVSGGPDSTALMVLAVRWRAACPNPPRLIAVTVDHGLRPGSKREAKAVERLARTLGVEHQTLRWTGRKPKTGLQEAARSARYRLLDEAASKAGAHYILTGHTLDDQAETVLFRMARGSGVGGLAGMGHQVPVPVKGAHTMLVRPFLEIPKARLIATLKTAKIPFADDSSNRDPRFTRSRMRVLMPALAQEGLTAERLATLARRVQQVEDTLFEVLNDTQAKIAPGPWPDGGPITIDVNEFLDIPDEIAMRLLERTIAWTGREGPVQLSKLEALYAAMSPALTVAMNRLDRLAKFRRTLAGAMITIAGDRITVERAPPRSIGRQKSLTTRPRGARKPAKAR